MNFRIIFLMFFAAFCTNANSQNITVDNGVLKFSTTAVYEQYAENVLDRNDITNATASITTLSKQGVGAGDSDDVYPEFLQTILNTDKIFGLGSFLIKMDLENERAFAIASAEPNAYNTLLASNAATNAVLLLHTDEANAIDVLNAITDNTLSIADYNGATEQSRIRWPWNRCSGAGRSTQKRIQEWGKGIDKSLGCLNDVISYAMDNKLVYQKAIFYFSLEAKTKSLKGCPYSNWLLVPGYNTSQQLISTARFVKVNSCRSQENRVQNVTNTGTVLNWRPYEGSRALSKYEADADFGVKYDYNTPADPFIMSIHFHIMSGF